MTVTRRRSSVPSWCDAFREIEVQSQIRALGKVSTQTTTGPVEKSKFRVLGGAWSQASNIEAQRECGVSMVNADKDSGMHKPGYPGDDVLSVVWFRSVVGQFKILGIMVGMDQTDMSYDTSWLSEYLEIDPIMDDLVDTNVVMSMFPVEKKPRRAYNSSLFRWRPTDSV